MLKKKINDITTYTDGMTRIGQALPKGYRGITKEIPFNKGEVKKILCIEFLSDGSLQFFQIYEDSERATFSAQLSLNKEETNFILSTIKNFDWDEEFKYMNIYLDNLEKQKDDRSS